MIATFKETIASLRDNKYGQVIIGKPLKSVIWYWTKYLLLVSLIPVILVIVLLTRFLPEVPSLINKYLPEGTLGAKDHLLYTTISQPIKHSDSNFSFIFDLNASPSAIEASSDGVLILKDRIVAKTSDGRTQIQTFENLPDFSTDKSQIADWISSRRSQIWIVGTLAILLIAAVIIITTWVIRLVVFLIWTLIIWLITKYLLKKSLVYSQILNIVIYSSIIPLLFSLVLALTPNPLLSLLNTGIFLFFVFSWIRNIPPPVVASAPVTSSAPVPAKRKRVTRA